MPQTGTRHSSFTGSLSLKELQHLPPWKSEESFKARSILGDQDFIEKIEPALKDKSALEEIPIRERLAFRPSLEQLLSEAKHQDISERHSKVKARGERDKAILSVHVHYGYTLSEIGAYLGLTTPL
ncbi:MAG: hypothetical protein AB1611_05085 [bacterium]